MSLVSECLVRPVSGVSGKAASHTDVCTNHRG